MHLRLFRDRSMQVLLGLVRWGPSGPPGSAAPHQFEKGSVETFVDSKMFRIHYTNILNALYTKEGESSAPKPGQIAP